MTCDSEGDPVTHTLHTITGPAALDAALESGVTRSLQPASASHGPGRAERTPGFAMMPATASFRKLILCWERRDQRDSKCT